VVGVAKASKTTSIMDEPGDLFYTPQSQNYKPIHVLQMRTTVPPETLIPVIEAQVRELEPNLPLFDVMSMDKSLNGANVFFCSKSVQPLPAR
jgi:hypothetical protein